MTQASAILAPDVPASLIYEWDDGQPIYYRGYQEVLMGKKTAEEIIGDSTLQAWIKSKLYLFLCNTLLDKGYEVLVGEIGMQLAPKSTRAADIAIFAAQDLVLSDKYSARPPEVVIEIDVKADYPNSGKLIEYYERKTQKLLDFGVKKVIWVFTDSETVLVVENGQKSFWEWTDEVEILAGVKVRLEGIVEKR